MSTHNGWIGVDLDGTLAHYDGWKGPDHVGEPIPAMVARIQKWISEGKDVRIFTARVGPGQTADDIRAARIAIWTWLGKHVDAEYYFPIVAEKDLRMFQLWDDRCVCVERNTGRVLGINPGDEV